MSRNYQRDDRDWRRQQQNWNEENQWSRGRRDREDEDYGWSGQEMGGRWSREQGAQGTPRRGGVNEREVWQGRPGHRWEERGEWQGDRGPGWQGDRWQGAESQGRGGNLNERYEGLGGRGWYQGWNQAMHRGEGQYAGRGPRNYQRSDNRIEEDINDRLTQHPMIDASDVEVTVQNCEVTLRGQVDDRQAKRLAEDIAESVFGVKEINNQIKVKQRGETEETRHETETPGKQRRAS